MSKAKRVMQQNKRAAFVLDMTPEAFFLQYVVPTLSAHGRARVYKWGGLK